MLDAVMLLRALAVVKTVERADQIAGDAADALKTNALANHFDAVYFGDFKLLCHGNTPFPLYRVNKMC